MNTTIPIMGPPNRAPGTPIMGETDSRFVDWLFTGRVIVDELPRTTIDQLLKDARRQLERVDRLAAREAISNGAVLIDIRSESTETNAMSIDAALERNRVFAAASGHEGGVVFPNLRLFVITCLDPRVDPAHFLGLGLSDAIVVRNVGRRATPEAINDVAFIARMARDVLPDRAAVRSRR